MAKISSYPILSDPTINDILIGTDVQDLNITKNFSIGSIIDIVGNEFVPYVGATGNVNLGAFNITSSSFIVAGGSASQFLKANGTLDSTVYVPASRTLTINSVTYDLSANRSWSLNTIDTLTTIGTSGAATYIGKTLNIPQYQAQGSYITQLSGEATAVGPGNATVTLSNLAVISKVLTGLNITGGTISDTDSILTAFGKVQNQINGLAGGVTYQGTWNAATNTPALTSSVGTKGFYYVVSVPGSTNLNGITDWKLGDWAIFNGSVWEKVDNTDAVVSVNGYTGAVVLTFSDVGAPPATRTLTINGTTFDLTADRSWTVGDVRTDQTYSNPTWISSLAWGKITGTPTTLAGYGITDGASNTTTLTINGTTFDLSANRTWNVGTVTSVGTSGPLTGGTITGSGTIGITQAGASSDGYLSSTDWNTFNNKQNALTNPVTGTGTIFTLPMWSGATSLVDSPLSYGPDTFNFQYNSATGGTVNFTNIGLTTYTYAIQMNNFGSPRSTVHSYTDGVVVQSIGGTQVSRVFANGNTILGAGVVDNGYKLEISGNLYVNSIVNATADTDRFIVSDGGLIKYRTGAQLLSDIGAQGALTLTTTGTSGPATLVGNTLNIPQYTDQFVGTVTSVGLSMPPAFTVSNSPVTSAGTLTVVGAGTAAQYVRGDGTLGDFPGGGGGGGSSVSYYLNGSINQGTFVGNTYYEMSKTPIFGAGTDFSINTNGYIAQFITDANDPESLLIPAGNWNLEFYFSASSGGGSPTFYVELYKYDGTTFTLIASNSTNPELISLGTTINPYFSALGVPETVLAATDRLAIRIYVTNAGRTITLHTENSHLCQVITTFTTGLTALNGLTKQVQYLTTGTAGTDFNIVSSVATHTFNLPTASAVNRGALSSADWSTFNSKIGGTLATGQVAFGTAANTIGGDNGLFWDNTNKRLGVGITTPIARLNTYQVNGGGEAQTIFQNFSTTTDTTVALYLSPTNGNLTTGTIRSAFIKAINVGGGVTALTFGTNSSGADPTEKWRILSTGILQSNGAQTIQTSTGNLTLATAGGNGNILLSPNGTGGVGINTASPTATLDIRVQGSGGSASTASNSIIISPATITDITEGEIGSQIILNARRNGVSDGVSIASVMSTANFDLASMAFYTHSNSLGTPRVESMRIFGGSGNVVIQNGGTFTDAGFRLDVNGSTRFNGLSTIQGTTASDSGQLGAELLTTGTGDASWTGTSFATGYTHVVGSTTTLTSTLAGVVNTFYQITYTVTGRTAGSFTIAFGGFTSAALTATGAVGPQATTTGTLVITPTSDFNGTIVLSIRTITLSSASITLNNSSGTVTNQIRISSLATNTFIGSNAGRLNTTGSNNSFYGTNAGLQNTTGIQNSFFGGSAGASNTTGSQNSFFGISAGSSNTTGINNSFFGILAGRSNTTGGANSFFGAGAGDFNTSGANNSYFGVSAGSANTTASNNSFFGVNAGRSNTTGDDNSFFGQNAGFANTTGTNNTFIGRVSGFNTSSSSNNTFIGTEAGRYTGSGTTAMTSIDNSIYLGFRTRGLNATGSTNELVIGFNVVGLGSNTTVLGNTSTTHGRWYGSLLLGTTTNAASSILTMESTTQGFLPPRMTAAQRTAIASPAEGLIVFQTNGVIGLYIYANATWRSLTMV